MAEARGLTSAEAAEALRRHGENALPRARPPRPWLRFARQFRSPLIYLLLAALALDLLLWLEDGGEGWPVESIAIAAVLLLNAALGAFQEHRSEQALAQLAVLAAPFAWVVRDGRPVRVPGRTLVPGDLVRLAAGERVPADGVLVEEHGLLVDESLLTGESLPAEKEPGDEVASGTLAVRGGGLFTVRHTGARSTMGRLATMLGGIETEPTPLERRLDALGRRITLVIGGLALALAAAGIAAEGIGRFDQVFLFAVALAVAAVPEGMPAVVTLTLAFGVKRMARRRAVVRRLSAVEALGSVTVIATDKTGTLTESRMGVQAVESDDPEQAQLAMALANDAAPGTGAGDPLELGLVRHLLEQGVDVEGLRATHPRVGERPFDSAWKFMRVTVAGPGGRRSYCKGAPEVLLARSSLEAGERERWERRAAEAAQEGHRVLALACGAGDAEAGLRFLGLVLLWDPPRPEVAGAIAQARSAGIRIVLVTGDHPGTAQAVARAIGLVEDGRVLTGPEVEAMDAATLRAAVGRTSVFARMAPEHKLRLVEALEAAGEIVAVTGDGINDAPALKRSAVGVAMGQRGSDVAREVADIVLLDDDFATIVDAIEEGRNIYENIQAFLRFTFSTNVALVFLVVAGAVGSWVLGLRDPGGALLLPLSALQILWINFLGDGPPALALAVGRSPDVMRRPPRPPASPLLDRASTRFVWSSGLAKGGLGVALLLALPPLGYTLLAVQTVTFLAQSLAKLAYAYPARRVRHAALTNPALHAAVAAGVAIQAAVIALPAGRTLLHLAPLDAHALAVVAGFVGLSWAIAELAIPRARARR